MFSRNQFTHDCLVGCTNDQFQQYCQLLRSNAGNPAVFCNSDASSSLSAPFFWMQLANSCCQRGQLERLQHLLQAFQQDVGINPAAEHNRLCRTAAANGQTVILRYLTAQLPIDFAHRDWQVDVTDLWNEAAVRAAENGHLETLQFLIRDSTQLVDVFARADVLIAAAKYNQEAVIRYLLHEAPIDAAKNPAWGDASARFMKALWTSKHYTAVAEAIGAGRIQIAELFFAYAKNNGCEVELMASLSSAKTPMLRELIRAVLSRPTLTGAVDALDWVLDRFQTAPCVTANLNSAASALVLGRMDHFTESAEADRRVCVCLPKLIQAGAEVSSWFRVAPENVMIEIAAAVYGLDGRPMKTIGQLNTFQAHVEQTPPSYNIRLMQLLDSLPTLDPTTRIDILVSDPCRKAVTHGLITEPAELIRLASQPTAATKTQKL